MSITWGYREYPDRKVICISSNLILAEKAAIELLYRHPHMLGKERDINDPKVIEARIRGLVIQTHVCGFVQQEWPQIYLPPGNEGKWEEPCAEDFNIVGLDFGVDVFGPRSSRFTVPDKKLPCGAYIFATREETEVLIIGWHLTAEDDKLPKPSRPITEARSVESFIAWMNNISAGAPVPKSAGAPYLPPERRRWL